MANCNNLVKPKQIDIEALLEIINNQLDPCFSFPLTRMDMGILCLPLEAWDEIDGGVLSSDPSNQTCITLDFGELCE